MVDYQNTKKAALGGGKDIRLVDWHAASTCAAWVGATTGIGNLLFSLIKYWKNKPRIKVTLSDQYSSFILPSKYIINSTRDDKSPNFKLENDASFSAVAVSLRVINLTNSPVTLDYMCVYSPRHKVWRNYTPIYNYDYRGMNIMDLQTKRHSILKLKLAPKTKFPLKIEAHSTEELQFVGVTEEDIKNSRIKFKFIFYKNTKKVILKLDRFEAFLDSHNCKLV